MPSPRSLLASVRRVKKTYKKQFKPLVQIVWSPLTLAVLFAYSVSTFTGVLSVDAAPSSQNMVGFVLSGSMTNDAGVESGAGSFGNGNAGAFLEKSCLPVVVSLSNGGNSAANLSVPVSYIYDASGQAIDGLETIATSVSGDPATATNLNQFTFPGTAFSGTTSAWTAAGSLTAVVVGPYAGAKNPNAITATDTERHFDVTIQNVPANGIAKVILCARLGADAGQAPGSSVHVQFGQGGGGTVPINGTDIVELPSLTITKVVSGGTAVPSDFSFVVTPGIDGVSASSNVSIPANQSSVVLSNIISNGTQVFTVTEGAGAAGYAFSSGTGTNCTFAGSTGSATVTAAAVPTNAACSFTNTQLSNPQLTIIKQVTNDNGGTLGAGDFTINVTGTNVSSASFAGSAVGTTISLDPGAYSVTEGAVAGYLGSSSTDCSGTIAFGEAKICTITNNDQPGTLTVQKVVVGGTSAASDFLLTVNGTNATNGDPMTTFAGSSAGTVVLLNAGNYAVTEGPAANYLGANSAGCAGTMALGESKTCVVTNTFNDEEETPTQGTLIMQKHVINDSGFGTQAAANFTLDIHDTHGTVIPVTGNEAGTSVMIDPGQYSVTEAANNSYAATFGAGCSGSIAAGQTIVCLVTNDDYPALAPTKDILPSVQCVAPTNHNTYIAYFGYNNTNDTSVYLPIGTDNSVTGGGLQGNSYGQPEIFSAGASGAYPVSAFSVEFDGTPVTWLLRVAGDSTSALASSQSTACPTVTPARLTVFATVTNDNGGLLPSVNTTTSTVTSAGPSQTFFNTDEGTPVTLVPGSYSEESSAVAGYTITYSPDCAGDIVQGESLICTVTYNDIPGENEDGTITVTKIINNQTSKEILVTDFVLSVGSTNVDSGAVKTFAPGTYVVTETVAEGKQIAASDYTSAYSGDCSSTGSIILGSAQHLTCTITNTFPAPSNGGGGGGGGGGGSGSSSTTGIIVVTHVINDNSGTHTAADFRMHVTGENPSLASFSVAAVSSIDFAGSESGVSIALGSGSYSITQTNAGGYDVTMSAECSGSLGSGQVKTCVVTENDIAPVVVIPPPQVLGVSDEAPADPEVISAPAPMVLGATDEELPRTGFPVVGLLALVGSAAYVSVRKTRQG